jgi:hypothetical protein
MQLEISTAQFKILNFSMYHGMFEPSDNVMEREGDELSNILSLDFIREVNDEISDHFDLDAYKKALSEWGVKWFKDELDFSDLPFPIKILSGKIWSPREYNFMGDKLDMMVEVPDNIREILLKWVKDGNFDEVFMDENFGSYSGFMSFMPYTESRMIEVLEDSENDELDTALAMIMYQIMADQKMDGDDEPYYSDWYENWSQDDENDETNYLEGETPKYNFFMDLAFIVGNAKYDDQKLMDEMLEGGKGVMDADEYKAFTERLNAHMKGR